MWRPGDHAANVCGSAGGIGENDYSECMVPHTNRSLSISLRILLRSSADFGQTAHARRGVDHGF
jgi:hypothetical protein